MNIKSLIKLFFCALLVQTVTSIPLKDKNQDGLEEISTNKSVSSEKSDKNTSTDYLSETTTTNTTTTTEEPVTTQIVVSKSNTEDIATETSNSAVTIPLGDGILTTSQPSKPAATKVSRTRTRTRKVAPTQTQTISNNNSENNSGLNPGTNPDNSDQINSNNSNSNNSNSNNSNSNNSGNTNIHSNYSPDNFVDNIIENEDEESSSLNFSFLLIAGVASIGLVAVSSYRVLKRKSDSKLRGFANEYQYTISSNSMKYINEMKSNNNTSTNNGVYTMEDFNSSSVLATILDNNFYNKDICSSNINTNRYRDSFSSFLNEGHNKTYSTLLSEALQRKDSYPTIIPELNNFTTLNNNMNDKKYGLLNTETAGQVDENKRPNSFHMKQDSPKLSIKFEDSDSLKRRSNISIISKEDSITSKSVPAFKDTSIIRHSFLNPNIKIVRLDNRTQLLFEATENQPAIVETFPSLEREFVPAVPVPLEECKENTLHPHQIYQMIQDNSENGEFENYYAYTIEDKEYIIDPATNKVLEIHDLATDEYMIVDEELYLDFSGGSSDDEEGN